MASSPAFAPPVQDAELAVHHWVDAVYGFNEDTFQLFSAPKKLRPDGVRGTTYVVDLSGSMTSSRRELQMVCASFLHRTNAEGLVSLPVPRKRTAMVACLQQLAGELAESDVVIITDGYENMFRGALPTGDVDEHGNARYVDLTPNTSVAYLTAVAQYLTVVCKHHMYFVGIGADAKQMTELMVHKRNCYVAHVEGGASPRTIVGAIGTLRRRALQGTPDGNDGHGVRAVARAPVQEVYLSAEVQATIDHMPVADLEAVCRVADGIHIASTADTSVLRSADIKRLVDAAVAEAGREKCIDVTDPAYVKGALMLALEAMSTEDATGNPVPGAFVSGTRRSILAGFSGFKLLGPIFSKLVKAGLLRSAGKTPDGVGVVTTMQVNGESMEFTKLCPMYACTAPLDEVRSAAADTDWCAPRASIKRKRP